MDRDEIDDDVFEQLDAEDTLDNTGVADPLDEGYSPVERPLAVDDWGTTAREEAEGESLDGRLAREVPDVGYVDPLDELNRDDGIGDTSDTDGELIDDEVGERRSGRLVSESYVAEDAASVGGSERDADLWAVDVGIDGAGASAEEAAVHVVPDEDE
ncbi:MAG TPA: DUF5709 domain-containing protein [Pseudonocardiaceae bacterium]|nr:DUF5709 domain-containing protein [Pseudonocardiaceae bacterium]